MSSSSGTKSAYSFGAPALPAEEETEPTSDGHCVVEVVQVSTPPLPGRFRPDVNLEEIDARTMQAANLRVSGVGVGSMPLLSASVSSIVPAGAQRDQMLVNAPAVAGDGQGWDGSSGSCCSGACA